MVSRRLPPLNSLKAFEATARHLSVKKAALELNVTPAAVSHQLRILEEYLGVELFHRFNRSLELTQVAKGGLAKLAQGFDCLMESVDLLRAQQGGGLFDRECCAVICLSLVDAPIASVYCSASGD